MRASAPMSWPWSTITAQISIGMRVLLCKNVNRTPRQCRSSCLKTSSQGAFPLSTRTQADLPIKLSAIQDQPNYYCTCTSVFRAVHAILRLSLDLVCGDGAGLFSYRQRSYHQTVRSQLTTANSFGRYVYAPCDLSRLLTVVPFYVRNSMSVAQ